MAKSVNKVILLGHMGKDPEVRYTTSGVAVANFSLATNERFKDKNGEWQDRAEWHNLVAFDRTAEIVKEYLHKGSQTYIEGRLQTRSWDDKNTGEKKYKTEIVVSQLVMTGGGNGNGQSRNDPQGGSYEQPQQGGSSQGGDDFGNNQGITDEDIPF